MPSAANLAENGLPSSRTKKSVDLNIDVNMDTNGTPKPRQTKPAFTSSMYNNHSKKHDHYSKPYYYNQYGTSQKRLYQRWGRLIVVVFAILLILSYLPFFTSAPAQTSTPPAYERPRDQKAPAFAPAEPSVRDQILLYRIIGNDLPPRHKEGQTLSNLAFILQHEQSFPNTRKIFLLNRIVDPVNEAAIIRLLDEYKMEYIRAPFHEEDYVKMDFRLEDFPEKDFLHSDDYMHFSKVAKLRTLDYTYHDKNLYAMNNNGGRNTALRHAKSISNTRWIMPFDGNCFLSVNSFQEIRSQLERYGHNTKYFVVPMTRLLNNSVLLDGMDEKPKTPEEPQLIFRYDSDEEYNPNMRYGRRSKLELLWRVGALENRRSLNRPVVPWEAEERPYSKDKGNFKTVGWVFRLFSGNPQQEENKKEATSIRAFNRLLAIQNYLDALDEKLARRTFRQEHLFLFNENELAQIRYSLWSGDPDIRKMVDQIEVRADTILADIEGRFAPSQHPSGEPDQHDDDVGRNEDPLAARQYLKPDFVVSNEQETTQAFNRSSDDPNFLGPLADNVTVLALARYFVGNEKYGRWAANLVRVHFLNEYAIDTQEDYNMARVVQDKGHMLDFLSDQGYSFPSLNRVPRIVPKYGSSPIPIPQDLTKVNLAPFLDAIRILHKAQTLTHKEYVELQSIASEFLEYLVNSPTGIHLAQLPDHRSVLYDLQVAALATFTDDLRLYLRVANRCRMRIGKQFSPDGSQPYEIAFAQATMPLPGTSADFEKIKFHYETLNLQYWTLLARAIQNTGISKDIWHYAPAGGLRLSRAVALHGNNGMTPRLRPLLHMAHAAYAYSSKDHDTRNMMNSGDYDALKKRLSQVGSKWDAAAIDQSLNRDVSDQDGSKTNFGIPVLWMAGIA
ncbi:hypothetical protein INT44_002384 [Umbelopsis vinacea]|uniref:Alginate lyase domain-containing protein n=1 Tax=Umbelopsis vinacea TaxID=44442 RepID=A0A8H7Q4D5_9FUNG|nr:hypothetical protein INT44_002384 [Umbelopsis vinacea]